jgi:hypothetical protein
MVFAHGINADHAVGQGNRRARGFEHESLATHRGINIFDLGIQPGTGRPQDCANNDEWGEVFFHDVID